MTVSAGGASPGPVARWREPQGEGGAASLSVEDRVACAPVAWNLPQLEATDGGGLEHVEIRAGGEHDGGGDFLETFGIPARDGVDRGVGDETGFKKRRLDFRRAHLASRDIDRPAGGAAETEQAVGIEKAEVARLIDTAAEMIVRAGCVIGLGHRIAGHTDATVIINGQIHVREGTAEDVGGNTRRG